jgi:hypothetical protein
MTRVSRSIVWITRAAPVQRDDHRGDQRHHDHGQDQQPPHGLLPPSAEATRRPDAECPAALIACLDCADDARMWPQGGGATARHHTFYRCGTRGSLHRPLGALWEAVGRRRIPTLTCRYASEWWAKHLLGVHRARRPGRRRTTSCTGPMVVLRTRTTRRCCASATTPSCTTGGCGRACHPDQTSWAGTSCGTCTPAARTSSWPG